MLRQRRVSKLPPWAPDAVSVARELADEIMTNIGRYKLRHKPVIKITTHSIYSLVVRRYGLPEGTATGAFVSTVLNYLDSELEKRGFRLILRVETNHGRVKARLYQMPG